MFGVTGTGHCLTPGSPSLFSRFCFRGSVFAVRFSRFCFHGSVFAVLFSRFCSRSKVHGDFAVQWAGPVVVVDREQALQGFATIYSGEAKNTAGLWSIGGAPKGGKGGAPKEESPVSPSGAGCRALHDLAKNAGWRAAGAC